MKHLFLNRRWVLSMLAVSAFGAMGLAHAQARISDAESVSLDVARQELEGGKTVVIDIREPQEHALGVAPGMRLLPMRQLAARISEIPADPKQPVLLICNTQNRSSATLKYLRDKGYTNVRFVQGGMSEWARRAWPMVKP
jgi:rhodanese-related sulfurtransferase